MISVALCTYNGERFIREQLESILNQTMRVDEIVVCDDGSTDRTLQIIEEYKPTIHTSIHIHRNKTNLGPARNFQKAINLCSGDIIFLSDQDDLWMPHKVETIIHYFQQNISQQVVFTDAILIDENGATITGGTLWQCFGMTQKGQRMLDEGYGVELFANENRVTGATMAVRKGFKYLSHIANYCKGDILHDGALAMLAAADNQLGYINEQLIGYRIHPEQECGIGESLQHPVSDDPRKSSYTAVYWSRNRLPSPLAERIQFIVTRQRRQNQPLGPFRMMGSLGSYQNYYHKRWASYLCHDMKQWGITMWRRITH